MFIHWFPGHMTKAIRMMKDEIKLIDSVIYVLDARAPMSSINPAFDEVIGNKPILYVLNKADLVEKADLRLWLDYFSAKDKTAIYANSVSKANTSEISNALIKINKATLDKWKAKGVNKIIRAMVIGVPNCGKSTLINSFLGAKKAVTGNKPGVTKGKQWVAISPNVELMDTPGTLYPDFSDQNKAMRLALIGSVKEEILDICELSKELYSFLVVNFPERLKSRYGFEPINEAEEGLNLIAKARGYLLKGNEYDTERAAKGLVTDFRKLAFGKIIMEKP